MHPIQHSPGVFDPFTQYQFSEFPVFDSFSIIDSVPQFVTKEVAQFSGPPIVKGGSPKALLLYILVHPELHNSALLGLCFQNSPEFVANLFLEIFPDSNESNESMSGIGAIAQALNIIFQIDSFYLHSMNLYSFIPFLKDNSIPCISRCYENLKFLQSLNWEKDSKEPKTPTSESPQPSTSTESPTATSSSSSQKSQYFAKFIKKQNKNFISPLSVRIKSLESIVDKSDKEFYQAILKQITAIETSHLLYTSQHALLKKMNLLFDKFLPPQSPNLLNIFQEFTSISGFFKRGIECLGQEFWNFAAETMCLSFHMRNFCLAKSLSNVLESPEFSLKFLSSTKFSSFGKKKLTTIEFPSLTRTWHSSCEKTIQFCQDQMKSKQGFKIFRKLLQDKSTPLMFFFLGFKLTDLVFVEQGNSTFLDPEETQLNLSKLILFGKIIRELHENIDSLDQNQKKLNPFPQSDAKYFLHFVSSHNGLDSNPS